MVNKKNLSLIQVIILNIVALCIYSCTTVQSVSPTKTILSFSREYLTTIDAIIGYCGDHSFSIKVFDRDYGIVNTDFQKIEDTSKYFVGDYRYKLNFIIKDYSPKNVFAALTQTFMVVDVEKQNFWGTWNEIALSDEQSKYLFDQILNEIGDKLHQIK